MKESRQKLLSKVLSLRKKAQNDGIAETDIQKSLNHFSKNLDKTGGCCTWKFAFLLSIVMGSVAIYAAMHSEDIEIYLLDNRCLVDNTLLMMELARPAVSCDVCRQLTSVPTVDGATFSKEMFLKDFAYNGIPLLVKGGAQNWTAVTTFSFEYFKNLYESTDGALDAIDEGCQFFPYKTTFDSMADVFSMPAARSRFEPGEKYWYVGWSNCHTDVTAQLRKHYKRPEFLPDDSESSNLDWMFMGGFGGGADVHIDYVQRPSWQAMISGRKSWRIVPSPECDTVCHELNATMETGDIILVDTNMWYHSTYVHPGKISITIGSEYD